MTPVRSISVLPKVGNAQGNVDQVFSRVDVEGVRLSNYQAYDTEIDGEGTDISWITEIPNDKLFIEVSYKGNDGIYHSRKFDFGNFLNYVGTALNILDSVIIGDYLTQQKANELYLPLRGGTLSGPLTIEYDSARNAADANALRINAVNSSGIHVGLKVEDADIESTEYVKCKDLDVSETATINGDLIANHGATIKNAQLYVNGNAEVTGTTNTNQLIVDSTATVTGNLTAESNATINGSLTVHTGASIENITPVEEGIEESNALLVNGKTETDKLVVNKTATYKSDLDVKGNLTVKLGAHIGYTDLPSSIENGSVNCKKLMAGTLVDGPTIHGDRIYTVDNIEMTKTTIKNLVSISELTAQYACWA